MLDYIRAAKAYLLSWLEYFWCDWSRLEKPEFEIVELEKLNQIINYWRKEKALERPRSKSR